MYLGRLFLFLVFFSLPVFAQTQIESFFQKDNPNIVFQNEPYSLNGQPFVYLEGVSDRPQPKTWQDKLKMRLFGSLEIPKNPNEPELNLNSSFISPQTNSIEIQPVFGKKKQVAYVPHTADWKFVITLSETNLIDIDESMTFILTEKQDNIQRDWFIPQKNFHLIQAQLDRKNLIPQYSKEKTFFQLPSLFPGVHTLHFNYIIDLSEENKSDHFFSLIGQNWPLIADRFSGILFSKNTKPSDLAFLIGANHQQFPENFQIQKDDKGSILFQMTKILPPKTPIQFAFSQSKKQSPWSLFSTFWITLIIISFYVLISCLEIKYMSLEKKLKKFHFNTLNPFFNFLHRSGEICIGASCLLILSAILSFILKKTISFQLWYILICTTIILIVLADFFVFYPEQKQIFKIKFNFQKEKK